MVGHDPQVRRTLVRDDLLLVCVEVGFDGAPGAGSDVDEVLLTSDPTLIPEGWEARTFVEAYLGRRRTQDAGAAGSVGQEHDADRPGEGDEAPTPALPGSGVVHRGVVCLLRCACCGCAATVACVGSSGHVRTAAP